MWKDAFKVCSALQNHPEAQRFMKVAELRCSTEGEEEGVSECPRLMLAASSAVSRAALYGQFSETQKAVIDTQWGKEINDAIVCFCKFRKLPKSFYESFEYMIALLQAANYLHMPELMDICLNHLSNKLIPTAWPPRRLGEWKIPEERAIECFRFFCSARKE